MAGKVGEALEEDDVGDAAGANALLEADGAGSDFESALPSPDPGLPRSSQPAGTAAG